MVAALNLTALLVLVVSFVRWFDGNRRENLARLEAAQQARTIFLANISHEIRTPMNGVLGLTELVLAGALEAEQRERLELVQRSGQSLVTLIDDLLLLTRAESGRLTLLPSATPVAKVVADVVELFTPVAQQKQVELRVHLDERVPRLVELDSVRWRQVLTNLVSNAVKFTERGAVDVRLVNTSGRLVLTVSDQGVGIAPDVLARLFQPFEQGDVSTTRRFGGSGLGLALSRQLVEAMQGTITVSSQPGQGSLFTVDVPLVPSEEVTAPASRDTAVAATDLLVLVVDDNPINLKVAQGLVERAGYRVQVARDGQEAVDAAAAQDFALVLMDCQMPEMDGLEATRRIRASARNASTPIIAVTASGLAEQVEECRLAGMNDVLVKPVSLEQIKRALALAR
jgi:CheY-like chemotaxis protein